MSNFIKLIKSFLHQISIFGCIANRMRFPGLGVAYSVKHDINGKLHWRSGTSIGHGCNIVVPFDAELSLGEQCYVGRYVELGPGREITIGDYTSIQDRSVILGDVSIGAYCVFSFNTYISSGRHYYDLMPELLIRDQDSFVSKNPQLKAEHSRPIMIHEDCWIGINSVIMPGISIGKGCVVGANSVVTKSLPPYSVAVGAPAKVVKQRLEFLPPEHLYCERQEHLPYFYSGFGLMAEERRKGARQGGIFARSRFSVWLDGDKGQVIALKAISVSRSQRLMLSCGEMRIEIIPEWEIYKMSIANSEMPVQFHIESEGSIDTYPLLVKEVWIEQEKF
ncbi:MAG: putative transferase [Herminiimonas sp.]|nr:putative transferase [Herminiimonas sp.]